MQGVCIYVGRDRLTALDVRLDLVQLCYRPGVAIFLQQNNKFVSDPMKKANQQAVLNSFSPMSVVPACDIEGVKAFKTSKTVITCHGNYSKKSVVLPGV